MTVSILTFLWILIAGIIFLHLLKLKQGLRDNIIIIFTITLISIFNIFKDWQNMSDIATYVPTFKYIATPDATYMMATSYYKMQYGYYVLNKIIALFSHNIYWFMFSIGLIICLPYFYFIKKFSPYVWLSCILYFMGCPQSMCCLRQYSAMAFCLLALALLMQGTKKAYTISVLSWLIAIWIHPTAVIFGAVYLIWYFNLRTIYVVVLAVLLIIPTAYLRSLIDVFVENTSGYAGYLESEENNYSSLFIVLFHICTFLIFCRPFERLDKKYILFYKMLIVAALFQFSSTMVQGGGAINRMMMYFTMINPWFLPIILSHIKTKLFRYVFAGATLALSFYLFALSGNSRLEYFNAIL